MPPTAQKVPRPDDDESCLAFQAALTSFFHIFVAAAARATSCKGCQFHVFDRPRLNARRVV